MNRTSTQKKISTTLKTKKTEEIDNVNDFSGEPGKDVINNILNYSKSLVVKKSKMIEHLEMVLN